MAVAQEKGLLVLCDEQKVGFISFSPLQQGLLTNRYLEGVPEDSRMARDARYLKPESLSEEKLNRIRALKAVADARGQKLHHMALQWVLRDPVVTSALIGASRPEQIVDNLQALRAAPFTQEELQRIDAALR